MGNIRWGNHLRVLPATGRTHGERQAQSTSLRLGGRSAGGLVANRRETTRRRSRGAATRASRPPATTVESAVCAIDDPRRCRPRRRLSSTGPSARSSQSDRHLWGDTRSIMLWNIPKPGGRAAPSRPDGRDGGAGELFDDGTGEPVGDEAGEARYYRAGDACCDGTGEPMVPMHAHGSGRTGSIDE